ncbi:MAG: hypothetical protein ACLU3I_20640 [Acutalibacteraceae bacterium]
MSKATKKSLLCALGALALIAFAMWLRYASRHIFHSPAVSHLRSGIYVFLFSAWCYSLRIRIVQTQARRYLVAISALMVLWILLRSIKFSIEKHGCRALAVVFLLFSDAVHPHAVGLCFPVAGQGRRFPAAAMDQASVSSDAAVCSCSF